ncbi:MAG: radical SAM protein [Bacteroidia bacterium]|nr:radical SAM protein [Bacteroidia bacterium]
MKRKPDIESISIERYNFPKEVIIETSSFCNLKCIMCPYPMLKRQKGVMDFKIFKKIADEIMTEAPSTNLWAAIMGEPLMKWDSLKVMLNYAKEIGLENINLNTNSTYLTESVTEELLNISVSKLLVSLDSYSKSTYDKIRKGGDFNQVQKNIEYFLKRKEQKGLSNPDVIMQFIIMDYNEHEIEEFKKFWLKKGAIVKVRLKLGWGNYTMAEDLDKAKIKRDFPCPWLLRTISIHWNGKFAQCDADYEGQYFPGDIRTQSIKEVWQGELAKRREKHWNLDFSHVLCRSCMDWSVGRSIFYYPNPVYLD